MQLVASRFQGLFQWSPCSKTKAIQMVMEQLWLRLVIQNFHWICFLLSPRLLIHIKRWLLSSETVTGFLICSLLLSLGESWVQSDILSMRGKALPFIQWSLGNIFSGPLQHQISNCAIKLMFPARLWVICSNSQESWVFKDIPPF